MFEDDEDGPMVPNDQLESEDQQFFAALTLLCLAILGAGLWAYLVLTVGVYGPHQ